MALTKPKLSQNIDTDVSVFSDPILVLHQGSTSANLDVGFLMNRSNGLTSNAAVIWQESSKSFVHILTNDSGAPDANLTVQSYANVSVGNVLLINNAGIYVDGSLGSAGQVLASDGFKSFWAPPGGFTGGFVLNQTTFASNLVVSNTTPSTSNVTGALVVKGGAGFEGNVYADKIYTSNGLYWAGNGNVIVTGGGGGGAFTSSNTAPVVANDGDFWYKILTDTLYQYIDDGTSTYWVDVQSPILFANTPNTAGTFDFLGETTITGNLIPSANVTYSLGSQSYQWRDLWVSNNTVYIGNTPIRVDGNRLLVNNVVIANAGDGSNLVVASTENSSSVTSGALVVRGGMGVAGNLTFGGNATVSGKVVVNDVTDAIPYVMGSGAFHVAGGMSIGKDFWVGGNIYVANVISQTSTILQVSEPLVYLFPNSAVYNYDIGSFSDFPVGGNPRYTGVVRSVQSGEWVFFSNISNKPTSGSVGISESGVIYDPVKVGNLLVANTTASTNTTTGALIVRGGAGIAGNIELGSNLEFNGTGNRILGDFSNTTIPNRVMFQSSTTNGQTNIYAIPNGAGTTGVWSASNNSDPNNASIGQLAQLSTELRIQNVITGTGTYLPMTFYTGGSEAMRIDTSGNVGIGTTAMSDVRLDVFGGYTRLRSNRIIDADVSANVNALVFESSGSTGEHAIIAGGNTSSNYLTFYTANSAAPAERMRINASGNVTIGGNVNIQSGLGVGTAAASGVTGEIRASDNVTAYFSSDARFKENVRPIPGALDKVSAIGGKLFDWTDDYITKHGGEDGYFVRREDFGVIAQDVQAVFPEAVRKRADGFLAVDYEKLSALAFAAIAELKQIIDELRNQGKQDQ